MDANTLAYKIVKETIAEDGQRRSAPRSKAARAGGIVGGANRAKVLSPERRKEISVKANDARWGDRSPKS